MPSPLLEWLRGHTAAWSPSIVGVFREDALHDWPLTAHSATELRQLLTDTGHLLPLPSEPAALANVMEIELRRHLVEAAVLTEGGGRRRHRTLLPRPRDRWTSFRRRSASCRHQVRPSQQGQDRPQQPNRALYGQHLLPMAAAEVLRDPSPVRRVRGAHLGRGDLHLRADAARADCRRTSRDPRDLAAGLQSTCVGDP